MTHPAAIYLRVSSATQADEKSFGLDAQEAACRAYAQRHGLNVTQVYRDVVSGTVERRAAFQQLIAEAGHYEAVVVYSLDRLARTVPIAYGLAGALADAGLELHGSSEGRISFDGQDDGLMFGISAVVSSAERSRIARRMMGGKLAKIRAGKPLHVLKAYGWKNDAIEPTEAAWVQWMYQSALTMGVYSIVDELARLEVPSPRGDAHWDPSRVVAILRDSAYRGEWVFGRVRRDRKTQLQAPISAPCPRIVSDELWYGVQRAIDGRRTGQGRRSGRPALFPLQGRITCGNCGRAMVGHQASNRPGMYYTCGDKRHPQQKRRGCTNSTYYPAVQLHAQVREMLAGLLAEDADLTPYLPAPQPQVRDNTQALADINARLRRVKVAYEEGIDTLQEYRERRAGLEAARTAVLTAPLVLAPRIDPQEARRALQHALTLEDLHEAAAGLGLSVQVGLDGALSVKLDPVI